MFSMRKFVLVGATAGAAALTAMSTAWACTGYDGTITVTPGSGYPGGPIDVFGRGYIPGNGPIQLRWDSVSGTVLGTATGESFTAAIKVPATAPARVHYVVAVQRKADGALASQSTVPFEVLAEAPAAPSTDVQQPTTDAAPATATPAPADPGAPLTAIPATSPALAPQPATAPASAIAPAIAAPSPAGAPPARPGVAPADVPSPALAGPTPDGGPAAPVVTPVPDEAPAADIRDLWSGLAQDPVGPSLTAPAPGRPEANPPLAVGLLALGAIGLGAGAVGMAQARRRTSPARAPRSRHDRQP